MNAEPLPSSQPAFSDQRTGLIVFGVLEILIGCFCALMVPLTLFGQAISARMTTAPPDYGMTAFVAVFYSVIAGMFIWCGVGSIMCRRWARALLLILSWGWLLGGIIIVGFSIMFLPSTMQSEQAGSWKSVFAFMLVMFSCMFLVIPSTLVCFYQSNNVKATCEVRDPVHRWTDACPLPVLAASLWSGVGALCVFPMPWDSKNVMPFFGILLTGLPATLLFVIWGVGSAWLAWAFYRLKPVAWWVAVVAFVLISVSSVITFARVDLMEMYRLMGYSQQQLEEIQKYGFFSGKTMAVWTAFCMAPWLGYLLWIKRFFRPSV